MTTSVLTLTNMPLDHAQQEESLSNRLTYALRILGVSQSELARRLGIKPQAIQYLCASQAKKSKFAFHIADALGINSDWLIAGKGRMTDADNASIKNSVKIPVIDWSNIRKWVEEKNYSVNVSHYINTQLDSPEHFYGLKMLDASMSPRFEVGTLLIVDPVVSAQENDYVIVSTRFSDQPIVRQLVKKDNKFILLPSNISLYKEIELTREDKILGVVRQAFYEFARR